MTEDELTIRDFLPDDEDLVQKWRKEYPLRDGTEDALYEIGDTCTAAERFIVCLKNGMPIGTFSLREIEAGKFKEVLIGIGVSSYMSNDTLRAMFMRVARYLKESYPKGEARFIIDVKTVSQLIKGDEK